MKEHDCALASPFASDERCAVGEVCPGPFRQFRARFGENLPVEFAMLGHRPKRWRPISLRLRMVDQIILNVGVSPFSRARLT